MSTVNKQYFLDLMAARKLSMRGLAKRMEMNHSQLSLTLSGQRRMQLDEAAALSDVFGVPLHDIALAAGIDSRPAAGKRVTVTGFVGGDGTVTTGGYDRTDSPLALPENAAAIQFRTADTPLSWMDAWVCFYVPRDTVAPDAIGRFCIASVVGGSIVVAAVKRGYTEGTYNLSGPHTANNVQLDWASPLMFARF